MPDAAPFDAANAAPRDPQVVRVASLEPGIARGPSAILCDLDGCLISEGRAFPDAAAFIAACGARLWIVSNDSASTAEGLSARLAARGLDVAPGRLLLAGEQTLRHLARGHPGARLMLAATPELCALAEALGFRLVTSAPEIVLLCRDPALTVEGLGPLAQAVRGGASFWVANTDLSHPGLDGRPVAETGALLAAVQALAPGRLHRTLGKPDPHLCRLALSQAGSAAGEAVFVGDNARTDGLAAEAAGIPFVHLRRGAA